MYFTKKGSPVTLSTDVPAFRFPPSGWHWPKDVPSSCHCSVCSLGQRLNNCRNAEQPVKGELKQKQKTRIEETTLHMFYCSSSMCLGRPTWWSWRFQLQRSWLTWPSVSNMEISGRSSVYCGPIHQHMGCTCVPVNVSNHIRNYQPQTRIIHVS